MSSSNEKARKDTGEVKIPRRSHEIQQQIGVLAGRDLQLLSITLLLLPVLSGGILVLVFPSPLSGPNAFCAEVHMLPQLFFGLTTLIILFNVYVVLQKRELSAIRRRLIEELILNELMKAASLIDPVTQLFNRWALEQMVAREVARTNRMGSALSLLVLDITDFEAISNQLGTQESEHFLYETAQLLKNVFGGSDMAFRYKDTQFLVVMPDTPEQQVDFAIKRLEVEIDRHDAELRCNAELPFSCGVAQFAQCSRISDTLLNAERKAFLHKHSFATVF